MGIYKVIATGEIIEARWVTAPDGTTCFGELFNVDTNEKYSPHELELTPKKDWPNLVKCVLSKLTDAELKAELKRREALKS